jgi:hypothetical protein
MHKKICDIFRVFEMIRPYIGDKSVCIMDVLVDGTPIFPEKVYARFGNGF